MKKLILLLCAHVFVTGIGAQPVSGSSPRDFSRQTAPSNLEAYSIVGFTSEIMNLLQLKNDIRIKSSPKVRNAQAEIRHGKKMIRFNPSFIDGITSKSGSRWTAVFVFAHEIGHHLEGHVYLKKKERTYNTELDADEFAGYIMCRMGASLQDTKRSVLFVGSPVASQTHPGISERVVAVEKGWKLALNYCPGNIP